MVFIESAGDVQLVPSQKTFDSVSFWLEPVLCTIPILGVLLVHCFCTVN